MEKKKGNAPPDAPDAVRAKGIPYLIFLRDLHKALNPDWYLEIGTSRGRSLRFSQCKSIAIDPSFKINVEIVGKKPALHMLQMESDAAFASDAFKALNPVIDIAFLDGMHWYEFLYRDVINSARYMAKDGVMFLHDTAPFNAPMTSRKQVVGQGGWTGDVWKTLVVLAKLFPDLEILHLDCPPTGLTMLRGDWAKLIPDPAAADAALAEVESVAIEDYGFARFYEEFPLVSSEEMLEEFSGGKV